MYHLFSSRVEVLEPTTDFVDGVMQQTWGKVNQMFDPNCENGEMMCRLDLIFVRQGKDAPQPIQAGRAPDRTGTLYCEVTPNLRAGQVITCLSGPITGSFIIKAVPDVAHDFDEAHHLEVQVVETAQAAVIFPGRPAQ